MPTRTPVAFLICTILAAGSCSSVIRSTAHVQETVAMVIKVTDAGTGEPVPAVVVKIKEGRLSSAGAGVTDQKGEYAFLKKYLARNISEHPLPEYLILELWKKGYKNLVVYIRSEDFVHGATEARLFKNLPLEIQPGRGSELLDLTKQQPGQQPE